MALPTRTLELLRAQRAQQAEAKLRAGASWRGRDAVLASETSYTPTPSNVRRGLIACCGRLGLPVLAGHSLQWESLSHDAAAGGPLKGQQARAGHSTPLFALARCQCALENADQRAAEALGRTPGGRTPPWTTHLQSQPPDIARGLSRDARAR